MTIRSTVKKTDRYGVQGSTSFNPSHPNANVDLYRSLEKFLMGDQGLGGAGGPVANRVKDPRSYQASHVFNTPNERDDVTDRLQKQLDEFLDSKFGETAKASGKSVNELLSSQGIQPIQYKPNDFIMASQNPLRGSTEKKIKAFMTMTGNTQSISGGTGEKRRHTGYYKPDDLKHVRSMLTTDARKLNEGTANLGEMEGLYLPASQKMAARTNQNIFKNGLTEDLLNNERHPVVAKIRSDMLKQHAMKQLKGKVQSGLQEEGLLPPDEDEEKKKKGKKDKPAGAKAMEAAAIITNKILSVAGDLKSLFGSAVGYLKNIASEIGGLKQDSAGLGITMNQALTEKYLAKMNPVFATDENVFLNAGKEVYDATDTPAKLSGIKWDSAVLHGQGGIIEPIVKAAVDSKSNGIETRNKIYNQMAAEYFNPKLSEKGRIDLRKHQMAALKSVFGESTATGYQVITDIAKSYKLVDSKNRNNVMGAVYNHTNKNKTRAVMYETAGMTNEAGYGSEENQTKLNDFLQTITLLQETLKKLAMVKFDHIVRVIEELILAILSLAAWFGGEGSPQQRAYETTKRRLQEEKKNDRAQLRKNIDITYDALLYNFGKAGYDVPSAEKIISEGVNSEDGAAGVLKVLELRKGSTKTYNDRIRNLFILLTKYKEMVEDANYADKTNSITVDPHNPENEADENMDINTVFYSRKVPAVRPGEWIKILKEAKKKEIEKKPKKKGVKTSFLPSNFERMLDYELPSRALDPGGSFLNKNMQGTQNVAIENTIRLLINDKEIRLKQDLASDERKKVFYADIT